MSRARIAAGLCLTALSAAIGCGELEIGDYPRAPSGGDGGRGSAGGVFSMPPSRGGTASGGLPSAGTPSAGTGSGANGSGGEGLGVGGDESGGVGSGGAAGTAGADAGAMGGEAGAGHAGSGGTVSPPLEKPDFLKEWEPHAGRPSPRLTTLGYSLRYGGTPLYAGYDNGDVFQRITAGSPWRRCDLYTGPATPPEDYSLPRLPISKIVQSESDLKSAWVGLMGGAARKIWRTSNGSASWHESLGGPLIDVASLSVDPFSPSQLLGLGFLEGGVYSYHTLNYGTNWSAGALDQIEFPATRTAVSVVVADGTVDRVWVGTVSGELFTSVASSGARTWRDVRTSTMPARAVSSIALSLRNPDQAYVTFVGPFREGVWVTTDAGQSFDATRGATLPDTNGAADAIYGLSVHPVFEGVLYLMTSQGPFWTADGASSWHR